MKTFLRPLSAEEELHYLRVLHGDDEKEAKLAREILIERNLRLVAHVAKKYAGFGEEQEDLISTGTIGLMKAVMTYKADKGTRLATYAAKCIDNELLMLFRARKKMSKEVSLYEPIGTDKEGNEIHFLDICEQEQPDFADRYDRNCKIEKLAGLIRQTLTIREQKIIAMRYGLYGYEEMTQQQIGAMLGISRSYVSRIEKRALQKLKKVLSV